MNSFRNSSRWVSLGLLGLLSASVRADSSIQWRGSKGWEPESAYCRLYDPKTVATIQGTIERVEKVTPMQGMGYGVYFTLRTNSETIPVHLGPVEFVEKQTVQLHAQEAVEVTGSRVSCDGKPVILAAMIKRGGDIVRYRKSNGRPAWAVPTSSK